MGSAAETSASASSTDKPRPPLPVMALREKIVEKVRENRVTLIVGDTGCGKSSQVPLFLLEENMLPVLCTQPRRFAVVAIARMVANARNCDVGDEIGYHIGHSNVSDKTSSRSKIVFKTAGVVLEQMRDKGLAAMKYKVIILDEVHERSVESDLVLVCVKQFMMKNKDLRVVLMSATADIARYRDYFKDLGRGERVEVIAIPSAPRDGIFQRKVFYLEQVAELLDINPQALSDRYCSGSSPEYADADLKPELHALIHKLILFINQTEPDIEKSLLVFLPTYHALEQQWDLLRPFWSLFRVHILHRSIDTDQALLAMRTCNSHRKCTQYVNSYFGGKNSAFLLNGKKELLFMANLCAYQFWQRVFKDKLRLERLKQVVKVNDLKSSGTLITKLEEEWCLFHNLLWGSLHHISDIYDDIINGLHRFRPDFFVSNEFPTYHEPYAFKHACLLQSKTFEDGYVPIVNEVADSYDNENRDSSGATRCLLVPFVGPGDFQSSTVAEKFRALIKEIRMQYLDDATEHQGQTVGGIISKSTEATMCKFFLNGSCNRGDECYYSHSLQARKPLCKFFLTFQGCRYGDSCFFLHDYGPRILSGTASSGCFQEDEITSYSFLKLLPSTADGCVLVFNDKNLHFTSNLSQFSPNKIIATTAHPDSSCISAFPTGVRVLWNVRQPCQSIIETKGDIPWKEVNSVLWFADYEAEDSEIQFRALQNFLELLAVRILADSLSRIRLIIIMNNIRFAQCQVERLARDCFFFLTESAPFDEATFGRFSDSCIARPMQACRPICYAFEMVPPTDIQFGDYAAALHIGLYNNQ
ncbi:hypothetical protein KFK09_000464 [Dendrobium nobile]|uniref:Zinc finger CCCH domain-containing protein 4 n=1 Tax=Dendrobium nobile TaxID=94219 RepID=A0A8T3CB60_DENNO|nr:hypothetical protein KFK09_000464 [Dendrobium nobile]